MSGKKKCLAVRFEGVQRGFLLGRKEKFVPSMWRAEDGKGTGANNGKSGMRDMEAESTRIGAESMEGYVKLKTVTEIRQGT